MMAKRSPRFETLKAAAAAVLLSMTALAATENHSADLTLLSLEQLMNLEVTMVSKREQTLFRSPPAVFVLTHSDLKRSGATSIPEALRLVPGMEVGRIDASKWAVSARGFNAQFANKLLVLIDGRSVYTPLFSGVLWDTQDIPLEEVDRIEVVRGPGAALWGANAMNGIVNIKTRHAAQTQGNAATIGGGTEEEGFGSVRHGGRLGRSVSYRAYAAYHRRSDSSNALGSTLNDGWDHWRGGFRVDGDLASRRSQWMFKGEYYEGDIGQTIVEAPIGLDPPYTATYNNQIGISGMYLQGRWVGRSEPRGELTVETYFDRTRRGDRFNGAEHRNTWDLELQQHRLSSGRHNLVWGLGHRITWDDYHNTFAVALRPETRTLHTTNAFLHDEVAIANPRLWLSLGTKLERHTISGFELLPNLRLLWALRDTQVWWAAMSRAARTPSRFESDGQLVLGVLPPETLGPGTTVGILTAAGDPDLKNETMWALETGYRVRVDQQVRVDVAALYNTYDHLRSTELGLLTDAQADSSTTYFELPLMIGHNLKGHSWGAELAVNYRISRSTQLGARYSYLRVDLDLAEDSMDPGVSVATEGNSPRHQLGLGSAHDLRWNLRFNVDLRYVGKLTSLPVDGYLTADARAGWRPYAEVELAVVGRNLLRDKHLEFPADFSGGRSLTEVERSLYGVLTWRIAR